MIWIKEKNNIVGYVPVLTKQYSDDEIREMSQDFRGWSTLSTLVMHIQGITSSYSGDKPVVKYSNAPLTLYDITFDFHDFYREYLCFDEIPQYINQIFDVFQNLTIYKVSTYHIPDLTKNIDDIINHLQLFIPEKSTTSLRSDFNNLLSIAEYNAERFEELMITFLENNLTLSDSLFDTADEEMIKTLKQRRKFRKGYLHKSIHK